MRTRPVQRRAQERHCPLALPGTGAIAGVLTELLRSHKEAFIDQLVYRLQRSRRRPAQRPLGTAGLNDAQHDPELP